MKVMTMSHKKDNSNRDRNHKGNQVEILQLKSIITKIENSLGGLNSRFEMEEDRACKFEDRSRIGNLREKQMKNEQSLRECENHQCTHICIMWAQKERREAKKSKIYLKM